MKLNKHLKMQGHIKDRGSIKWTAMMLPEHVQLLRDEQAEDRSNVRPQLDEFDLEAIQDEIQIAFKSHSTIELRIWRNAAQIFVGRVTLIDPRLLLLQLDTGLHLQKVSFNEIIGVKILD